MNNFQYYPGNYPTTASLATFAEFAQTAINIPISTSVAGITAHPPGPKGRNFVIVTGSLRTV
jgi:hypothetical protein